MGTVVIDMADIAEMLKVEYQTVQKWRQRQIFPEPAVVIGASPGWLREDVLVWAASTRRYGRSVPQMYRRIAGNEFSRKHKHAKKRP